MYVTLHNILFIIVYTLQLSESQKIHFKTDKGEIDVFLFFCSDDIDNTSDPKEHSKGKLETKKYHFVSLLTKTDLFYFRLRQAIYFNISIAIGPTKLEQDYVRFRR